ncbi:predicted protein, partial [Nematostella vectensis]
LFVSIYSQVVIAFIILVFVYVLIIFELVHRATAAMFGALLALATLSMLNMRPSLEVILTWIEWDTLSLLFGMMILVAVFSKTGFFDFVALKAYKISRGRVWLLVTILCFATAIISAFLDNVTTILLFTPITIKLCQVLNLDPTYVLIAEVIFSNIGGTATAIGDPPNAIIVSNSQIKKAGIDFAEFTLHISLGIVLCLVLGYGFLRLLYIPIRLQNVYSPVIAELKREAEIWRRTAERVPLFSAEEKTVKLLLMQKTLMLENNIRNMERKAVREEAFKENLQELENKYKITDWPLLFKSGSIICVVILLFFIHSFASIDLTIGWIAIMGAIALVLLADIDRIEDTMEMVEWTTLVFFAGLFILMKALNSLGLMDFLSNATAEAIQKVDEESRLTVAIIAILWISALASSFIDNIPFTTAMIPVVLELHNKKSLDLPLRPLVWALAMGACLGGNGTLIGASANVVCAGLSEQYGYPLTFNKFFRIGFPMMIATTLVAMGYLLTCHTVLKWDNK